MNALTTFDTAAPATHFNPLAQIDEAKLIGFIRHLRSVSHYDVTYPLAEIIADTFHMHENDDDLIEVESLADSIGASANDFANWVARNLRAGE